MHGSEVRGLLHPFLLLLIFERPGHGYDLIERLAADQQYSLRDRSKKGGDG